MTLHDEFRDVIVSALREYIHASRAKAVVYRENHMPAVAADKVFAADMATVALSMISGAASIELVPR